VMISFSKNFLEQVQGFAKVNFVLAIIENS
jgi:hypothetical protein